MNWLRANFYKATTYVLLAIAAWTAFAYLGSRAETAAANLGWSNTKTELAEVKGKLDTAEFLAGTVIEFNQGWRKTTQVLRGELAACQANTQRMHAQNEDAISKALAEKRDADAVLAKFLAQPKPKNCRQALDALDVQCPSLAGY